MSALQLYGGHNPGARSGRGVACQCCHTNSIRLQPALDSKHVDNVNAVTLKGGPQPIRDLIDRCDTLSKDSYVVGRQIGSGEACLVYRPGELDREGDLVSAVDFFKKVKIDGDAACRLLGLSRATTLCSILANSTLYSVFAPQLRKSGRWRSSCLVRATLVTFQ